MLGFLGPRTLAHWLRNSEPGRAVLSQCAAWQGAEWLYGTPEGKAAQEDVVQRFLAEMQVRDATGALVAIVPQTTYLVVECFADGYIRVHGPKHARVQIIQRPQEPSVKHELAVERWVELALAKPYRQVYGRTVASDVLRSQGFRSWLDGLLMRDAMLAVVRATTSNS